MTDPIVLAIAFPWNLEAKIINIHGRYSGYYFISKIITIFKGSSFIFHRQSFFQNNSKNRTFTKTKILTTDLSICSSIRRESQGKVF